MSSWILYNSHHRFAFQSVTSILRPAVCGVLRHSKGILSLPTYCRYCRCTYCINMLFNPPAQFHWFIYLFIFVFSFISPRIFLFNDLVFSSGNFLLLLFLKLLCAFNQHFIPSVIFPVLVYPLGKEGLQNWNFSQYSRCCCTITVFNVLFSILFMNNFLNMVAF